MGVLRYFLALVVIFSHAPDGLFVRPLSGGLAVQSFFIISGFYMSLIAGKYQLDNKSNWKNFYLSRAFRIFPLYYLCIFLTLAFHYSGLIPVGREPIQTLSLFSSIPSAALYIFSLIFIFGQDLLRFLVFNTTTGSFDFYSAKIDPDAGQAGSGFPLMGQTWTLALELWFYTFFPIFSNKKTSTIIMLYIATLVIRHFLVKGGYGGYNISYAFLPVEMGFFLLGILAHRIILPMVEALNEITRDRTIKIISTFMLLTIIVMSMFWFRLSISTHTYTNLIAISVPFLFFSYNASVIDRFIGELSYPVYMIHFIAIGIARQITESQYIVYYALLFSTLMGVIIVILFDKKIDAFRHKHFLRSNKADNKIA